MSTDIINGPKSIAAPISQSAGCSLIAELIWGSKGIGNHKSLDIIVMSFSPKSVSIEFLVQSEM